MGFFTSLAKAAIGPLIGAGASAFGVSKQNRAARAAAQAQMDFQRESMQNRWQWTVADMRKAGINPMLAYQQGAGPALGGATYQPQNVAGAVPGAVNSALAARRLKADLRNLESTNKNIQQDTRLKKAQEQTTDNLGAKHVQEWNILRENLVSARAAAAADKHLENFYKSKFGQVMRNIGTVGRELNPFASSARSLTR